MLLLQSRRGGIPDGGGVTGELSGWKERSRLLDSQWTSILAWAGRLGTCPLLIHQHQLGFGIQFGIIFGISILPPMNWELVIFAETAKPSVPYVSARTTP